MKGGGQRCLTAGIGWLAIACTVALSCSSGGEGAGNSRIDGTIALSSPDGNLVAQPGLNVTLLRGDLREMFGIVYKTTPEARARRALIASLEGAREEKNAAYERARAALAALDLPASASETTDCASVVESRLTETSKHLLTAIRSFGQRLDALAVSITDVSAILLALEEKSQQEEARELRSLVEEYQNRHLELQTSVLYDGRGAAWDRLCWRVSNNGRLNLARAIVSVIYNGRRLPIETVRLLWQISGDTLVLDFEDRDPSGGTVYGLAAGATAKGCYFAADRGNLTENKDSLESQGLASLLNPRSGAWSFVFDAVALTRTPRVETTDRETSASYRFFPPQALESVFAPELSARRPTFRARALLEEIGRSPAGLAWEQAQKASLACRTVVEMKSELARLDEKLAGLHGWAEVDPVTEGRVTIVVEDLGGTEQNPTDAEETLVGLIAERRAAEKTTDSGGAFDFADLKPGKYTVLARHDKESLGWIEVVAVDPPSVLELRRDNAIHASLAKTLARLD